MPISRLNRILDRPLSSYNNLTQRCLERADQEWRDGRFVRVVRDEYGDLHQVGGSDDDFSHEHKQTVIRRAAVLIKENGGSPDIDAKAPTVWHASDATGPAYYNLNNDDVDGPSIVDLATGQVEGKPSRGPAIYNSNTLDPQYRGMGIEGPKLVKNFDPSGLKSGDTSTFPDAGRLREQAERAARLQRRSGPSESGVPDLLPDAEMTAAIPGYRGLKYAKNESAPLLPSGRRAYGNNFPTREGENWRTPWRPGVDMNARFRKP